MRLTFRVFRFRKTEPDLLIKILSHVSQFHHVILNSRRLEKKSLQNVYILVILFHKSVAWVFSHNNYRIKYVYIALYCSIFKENDLL